MATRPPVRSSGILLYRADDQGPEAAAGAVEVLIGHMGGPFWAAKEQAAWTIPKGLIDSTDTDELAAARREFSEETGHDVPTDDLLDLGVFVQSAAKEIHIWAGCSDLDAATCHSNTFEMEWPPRSGRVQQFPELDRFEWCPLTVAHDRLIMGQRQVLDALKRATCTNTAREFGRLAP